MPDKKPKYGKKKGGVEIEKESEDRTERIKKFNEHVMKIVDDANASIAESNDRVAASYKEMEKLNPIWKEMMKPISSAKAKPDARKRERQSKTANNTQADMLKKKMKHKQPQRIYVRR